MVGEGAEGLEDSGQQETIGGLIATLTFTTHKKVPHMHTWYILQAGRAIAPMMVVARQLTLGDPRAPFLRGGAGTAPLRKPAWSPGLGLKPTPETPNHNLDGVPGTDVVGCNGATVEGAARVEQIEDMVRKPQRSTDIFPQSGNGNGRLLALNDVVGREAMHQVEAELRPVLQVHQGQAIPFLLLFQKV